MSLMYTLLIILGETKGTKHCTLLNIENVFNALILKRHNNTCSMHNIEQPKTFTIKESYQVSCILMLSTFNKLRTH